MCMFPLISEGFRIIGEGMARSEEDLDVAACLGWVAIAAGVCACVLVGCVCWLTVDVSDRLRECPGTAFRQLEAVSCTMGALKWMAGWPRWWHH